MPDTEANKRTVTTFGELERNVLAMKRPAESTHPNRAAFPTGMSGPSLRALSVAGIRSMDELASWTEADLAALHGMGPKGIRILADALAALGRGFRRGA